MDRLMLIVRIGATVVAVPAIAVESVVEIETMTPVPLAPPHVAGLAALRSRVVTIVDPRAALGLTGGAPELPFGAVIVPVDGHSYGIMVDEVVDAVQADGPPTPFPGRMDAGWAGVADAVVVIGDRQHLLIDPAALIAGDGAVPVAGAVGAERR